MSSLSSVEMKLPPGFRFHPRDEELICDYLMKWINRCPNQFPALIEVDLNKCEPWDIPDSACVGRKEWYFYSQKDKKYATGLRTNRATVSGYWKATGKDRSITRNGNLVGMRKTLVFYEGRAPKGRKTEWVMHEFRLEGNLWSAPKTDVKEDWVLCRVFFKNRSEIHHQSKQEPEDGYDNMSSQSIPTLTDPYVSFDPTHQASPNYQYDEQVPCFSIFTQNQGCPNNFPLLSQMEPPEILPSSTKFMPNLGQMMLPDFGLYNSQVSFDNSSCDNKMLRDVLDRLTKVESCNKVNNIGSMIKGTQSPSFGEGSSDSYLSEVGLSSMWNQC